MRKDQNAGINWQEMVTIYLRKDQINTLVCYIIQTGKSRMEEIEKWKEYLKKENLSEEQKLNASHLLQNLEEKDQRLDDLVTELNKY